MAAAMQLLDRQFGIQHAYYRARELLEKSIRYLRYRAHRLIGTFYCCNDCLRLGFRLYSVSSSMFVYCNRSFMQAFAFNLS